MNGPSAEVKLTRDEIRRLAGALREGAEWIAAYEERNDLKNADRLQEATQMHSRAEELYEIADQIRTAPERATAFPRSKIEHRENALRNSRNREEQ
jgi:hypothetical protein